MTVSTPMSAESAWQASHRIQSDDLSSICEGDVRWAPAQSIWLSSMAAGAIVGGALFFSWPAFALFLVTTAWALLLGHSLGSHRKLIHDSFQCPRWLERIMIYSGVLLGLAGPLGLMRDCLGQSCSSPGVAGASCSGGLRSSDGGRCRSLAHRVSRAQSRRHALRDLRCRGAGPQRAADVPADDGRMLAQQPSRLSGFGAARTLQRRVGPGLVDSVLAEARRSGVESSPARAHFRAAGTQGVGHGHRSRRPWRVILHAVTIDQGAPTSAGTDRVHRSLSVRANESRSAPKRRFVRPAGRQ